jgi:hypothetical protein
MIEQEVDEEGSQVADLWVEAQLTAYTESLRGTIVNGKAVNLYQGWVVKSWSERNICLRA